MAVSKFELMIGNLVMFAPSGEKKKVKDRIVSVKILLEKSCIVNDKGLDLELFYKSAAIQPIPLTPEITMASGFEKLPGTKNVFRIFVNDIELSVNVELSFAYIDTRWGQASIKNPIFKYLHQLQNLYFCLCGKELIYQPK